MIVTVRPKHVCRACTDGVKQAPAVQIKGDLPTEGAIVHILISKYADHLPIQPAMEPTSFPRDT